MKILSFIALASVVSAAPAQQRLTILLDPSRGGNEAGARIAEGTNEKQVTLDVANRLRSLLNARDFDVVLTREADISVSNDARAALANQTKPIACLLLHSTAAGKGLHLFTSSLAPAAPQSTAVPWDEAQAPYVQRSHRLENELATAFGRSRIPVSSGRTWIRPLDNMECPAIAVEIAPDADGTTAANRSYQTRIAETIAGAMLFWRGHADVMQSIVGPAPSTAPVPVPTEAKPPASGEKSVSQGESGKPLGSGNAAVNTVQKSGKSPTPVPHGAAPLHSVPLKPATAKPAIPPPIPVAPTQDGIPE